MYKILTSILLVSALLSGCSDFPSDDIESSEYVDIKLAVNRYNGIANSENLEIRSLNAFLFSNDTLLNKVYSALSTSSDQISLPIGHRQNSNIVLYFIANTENVSSGILKYIMTDTTQYAAAKPNIDLQFFTGKKIKLSKVPLGGKFIFDGSLHNTDINVSMDYAMASLNLQIEESNIEVDSIRFRNLCTGGYFVEPQTSRANYIGELFNHTEVFDTPVTSSQTIGYINQQRNNNDIEAKIYGKFNGIRVAISSFLPSDIERNTTYTIRLTKVGSTLTANIITSGWKEGETTESTPDVDAKVLIDPSQSVFGADVSCSESRDTLFIPSDRNNDILLAFDAQYELEATVTGNTADLSLESTTGFNTFRLKTNGQLPGSPAYYSYIMFRNRFFENSYGERIVVCVAPNKNYPLADISQLTSISGIKIVDNLATVSEYGSNDITISASKIRTGTDVFASFQTVEDISTASSEYKAIKLSQSGNNLILKSVANTTGYSQSVTVLIKGSTTGGKKVSTVLSITIPPVSQSEMDILNSLCTEMGSNVWMQFNTTGTFAGDVQRAKQLAALSGGTTVNNIKTNFNLFGGFADYYNNALTCPAGFRLPNQQEFCNLLGVANTAALSTLSGITSGSITTPGGMLATYYSFSTANLGQALVTISKGGSTMYLTNGRFATTPARGYFEFWHSGAFSINTASTNTYNWASRCVKDVSYKGLK